MTNLYNREAVQHIMNDLVGIVRYDKRLENALRQHHYLYEDTEQIFRKGKPSTSICELRNILSTAYMIVKQSVQATQNKGCYFSLDLIQNDAPKLEVPLDNS